MGLDPSASWLLLDQLKYDKQGTSSKDFDDKCLMRQTTFANPTWVDEALKFKHKHYIIEKYYLKKYIKQISWAN